MSFHAHDVIPLQVLSSLTSDLVLQENIKELTELNIFKTRKKNNIFEICLLCMQGLLEIMYTFPSILEQL